MYGEDWWKIWPWYLESLALGPKSLALALALWLKSLALALALQSNLTVLVFGLESTEGPKVASQVPLPITVKNYLGFVRLQSTGLSADPWKAVQQEAQFTVLHSLFEKIFCAPATSAPVERVFSHSGLFMRPHRARMGGQDVVRPGVPEM